MTHKSNCVTIRDGNNKSSFITIRDGNGDMTVAKYALQEQMEEIGKLVSDNYHTINDLAKTVDNLSKAHEELAQETAKFVFDNSMMHINFQKEVIMGMRENEIVKRCQQKWLEFSWFTKLFRKKYMAAEYEKIQEEVNDKYAPGLRECEVLLNDLKQKIVKEGNEDAK